MPLPHWAWGAWELHPKLSMGLKPCVLKINVDFTSCSTHSLSMFAFQ